MNGTRTVPVVKSSAESGNHPLTQIDTQKAITKVHYMLVDSNSVIAPFPEFLTTQEFS